jgi:pimeloyl-[acyl-carrier protein] methyl ester esterase
MDGTGNLFEPFAAALGSEFRVKIVRYPTSGPLGYKELEAFARAELPAEGSFVILGESFSGPIAISLAASLPAQLKAVVLCCSFARNPRPLLTPLRPLLKFLPIGLAPIGLLSFFLLGSSTTPALHSALVQAVASVSPSTIRARIQAVLSLDVSNKLEVLRVPVLYLRGSRDRVVPRAASELVSRLNPRAKVIELDAPHLLLQALPLEAIRVVSEFVREANSAA